MLDVASLAAAVAAALVPASPFLVDEAPGLAPGEAGPGLAAGALDLAQALWSRLRPRVEANAAARQTMLQVAQNPRAPHAEAGLGFQLQALLAADAGLAQELASVLRDGTRGGAAPQVIAAGERSVAIGGKLQNSTISMGDTYHGDRFQISDISGSQVLGVGRGASSQFHGNVVSGGQLDPQAISIALEGLYDSLGQASLPTGPRIAAQKAAGVALLEGVKDGEAKPEVISQNVQLAAGAVKQASLVVQEGSLLWQSVQQLATTLGPAVGGARAVAGWFGIPYPT